MKVTIKVLKGQDCTLEVSPMSTILEVKYQIEEILDIPAGNQKLLLAGRALMDNHKVHSYPNLKEGTKLNLIVMKPDVLRDIILRNFRKYFSEQQSVRLADVFMLDFETKFSSFSLDDIELFADHVQNAQRVP